MTENYLEDARVIALIRLKQFDKPTDEQIKAAASFAASAFDGLDATGLFEDLKYTLEITSEEFKQIQDAKTYSPWLAEARDGITWNFWRRYREYLRKSMAPDSIGELNRMTDAVLNNLFNPAIPGPHDRRGMVVGHVQSGKTGNYTGLVCKAADAGFRFIIILTGMTSDLRNQTQNRIDAGFIGRKTQSGSESGQNYIGVGADPKTRGKDYWLNNLTSSGLDGDFKQSEAKKYNSDFDGGIPIIAIVKKNGPVLANLIKWLAGRASYSEEQGYLIRNMPALIIDDEADNASVNTKYVLESGTVSTPGALKSQQETTTINSSIRALLMLFEQRAYVGYTATPFANIYIPVVENTLLKDMSLTLKGLKKGGVTDKKAPDYQFPLGQDLFPQDFIVNLSAPSNYVGPHRIFGMTDEDETSLLPVFVGVDDYNLLIPDGHKKGTDSPKKLPESLHKAIKCFILTCAIRRARGQEGKHNSMLVHVSRFNNWQEDIAKVISVVLVEYQEQVQLNDPELLKDLRSIWEDEYRTETAKLSQDTGASRDPGIRNHSWEEIEPQLHPAASRMEVRIVNGQAKPGSDPMMHPLDYDEADRQGQVLSVIAVGGDKLSRGFTLEGLSISYYLRATRMYDTLMQMARWFGYRPGYVDLCRLFTTYELKKWYRHVTLAMEEMRGQFDLISALPGRTPQDYGIRVRTLPGELQITAANKRRTGHKMELSYSGTLVETYNFKLSEKEIKHNMDAGRRLIAGLTDGPTKLRTAQPYAWKNVPVEKVLDFLNEYNAYQATLIKSLITGYIREQLPAGNLTTWTVVLATDTREEDIKAKSRKTITTAPFLINGIETEVETLLRNDDNNGPEYLLKNARILSPDHEALDLDEDDYQEVLELTRKEQKAGSKKATRPSGVQVRIKRDDSQGLLLLYPLDPLGTGTDKFPPRAKMPILGYAISFPQIDNDVKVSYVVNDQFFREPELGGGLEEETDD
jgi:hypothetical protein